MSPEKFNSAFKHHTKDYALLFLSPNVINKP